MGSCYFSTDLNHDIKRLPNNGTIIFPLSMSTLHGRQTPKEIYRLIDFFENKANKITNDVILLYTDGLYLNSNNVNFELHRSILNKMIRHQYELKNLIHHSKKLVPRSFHFLTWNQCIMKADHFLEKLRILEKRVKEDEDFLKYVKKDMGNRESTSANIQFILEEVVMSYCFRHHEIEQPKILSHTNEWNLIAYPAPCMLTEVYVDKHKILRPKKCTKFSKATYDTSKKALIHFDSFCI